MLSENPEPFADLHPETAGSYGIADGDPIEVESQVGRIRIKARVTDDILPGTVHLPHGWAEANVNLLTTEKPGDPISGAPLLKSTRCLIRKSKE